MYTNVACGVQSGTTQVPAALVAAIDSALSNSSPTDTPAQLSQAVSTAIQNATQPGTDPNAIAVAGQIAQAKIRDHCLHGKMRKANLAWYRLLVRQPGDFAGMRINPANITAATTHYVTQNLLNRYRMTQARASAFRSGPVCNPCCDGPNVLPIEGGFLSPLPNPQPLTTAPIIPPAPLPAPAAAPATPLPECRTGNICLDLRNGCVLSSQVDPQQLLACAQAGYTGNVNKYPAIAATGGAGGGAFLGTPMPNPPQFNPGMGAVRRVRWTRPRRAA